MHKVKMHENLLQIVEHVQSEKVHGSIVKDIITDREFFVPGLFLDKENENGELLLFELPKSRLEQVE